MEGFDGLFSNSVCMAHKQESLGVLFAEQNNTYSMLS